MNIYTNVYNALPLKLLLFMKNSVAKHCIVKPFTEPRYLINQSMEFSKLSFSFAAWLISEPATQVLVLSVSQFNGTDQSQCWLFPAHLLNWLNPRLFFCCGLKKIWQANCSLTMCQDRMGYWHFLTWYLYCLFVDFKILQRLIDKQI